MKKSKSKRILLTVALSYIIANVLFFLLNPFSSPWHYHTHDPEPIPVINPDDIHLSIDEISRMLDAIDLAYGGRMPTPIETAGHATMYGVSLLFFPASFTLHMKEFVGYIGPSNSKQQAFTLSVKKRYNHLAKIACSQGLAQDGFLFVEDPSLEKLNGASFQSLRPDDSTLQHTEN